MAVGKLYSSPSQTQTRLQVPRRFSGLVIWPTEYGQIFFLLAERLGRIIRSGPFAYVFLVVCRIMANPGVEDRVRGVRATDEEAMSETQASITSGAVCLSIPFDVVGISIWDGATHYRRSVWLPPKTFTTKLDRRLKNTIRFGVVEPTAK